MYGNQSDSVLQFWRDRALRRWVLGLIVWGIFILAYFHLGQNSIIHQASVHSQNILGKTLFRKASPATPETVDLMQQSPQIDLTPQDKEDLSMQKIQKDLPSLPIIYWNKTKNRPMYYRNSTCARFPSIYDIEFDNIYWQTFRSSNGTFKIFGAYYDIRRFSKIGPAIRILAMIDRIDPTVKSYCQIWFEDSKEPVFLKTLEYKYIWYKKWGNYKQGIFQPYLVACQMPQGNRSKIPVSVSLVEKPCDNATNNIRVIYNRPEGAKKKFAVCVKGLDFLHEDLSVRLTEWIELLGLLGAEKIFFYKLQIHPNISKVLDYYQERGKISVTPLTLPGGQPNLPTFQHMYLTKRVNHKRQNELIPYNDCLYKNLYMYEHIALLDIDEIIMPLNARDWGELMQTVMKKALVIKNETRASYNFRNVYFLDDLSHAHGWFKDIPKYMHMLQHVYRTVNYTKPNQYVKCFHNPERVLTLHNHFPLACLGQACTSYAVETKDAQLQHYRADCVKTLKKTCEEFRQNSLRDTAIWRFKEPLIERVTSALYKLGFFKKL